MRKIGLIIIREFTSKIRNRTLIIMTFLAPLLLAGFFSISIFISQADRSDQRIQVIDETHFFGDKLKGNDYISFTNIEGKTLDQAQDDFYKTNYTSILYIPRNMVDGGDGIVKIFYKKVPGAAVQNFVRDQIERIIYEGRLAANDIDPHVIENARKSVKMILRGIDEKGKTEDGPTDVINIFGFLIGALMFIFIMVYGMMVMRSVMEEKTNRIVEIIVSSVRPFELMIGKILGIALLGICQFIVMGILTVSISGFISNKYLGDINKDVEKHTAQKDKVYKEGSETDFKQFEKVQTKLETIEIMKKFQHLDFLEIGITFVLFFLGGYLFYSSLLAAIGSAVDSEADTQQFMAPVMLPLITGYIIAINMLVNPEGNVAIWGSMIPFTSPIVMMARIPFGVPIWQIVLSLLFLFTSFLGTTWLAGRIYRTGILMYGKKASWRELAKWLFYKG